MAKKKIKDEISGSTSAIIGGRNDENTPEANAVVNVTGCTGTLIAPNLVVTAGHCYEHGRAIRDTWRPPAGCSDREVPGRWYPTSGNIFHPDTGNPITINVGVGNDRRNYEFETTATDYTIPGCADILLLRLQDPVPNSIAKPIKVLASIGNKSGAQDADFFRGEALAQVGWGPTSSGTSGTLIRQIGATSYNSHDEDKMYTGGSAGDAQVLPGDSGGPLLWTHASGEKYLIAVLQGIHSGGRSRYTPTFANAKNKPGNLLFPAIGEFFDMTARDGVAIGQSLNGPAGTLPLFRWYSPTRKDNWTTTDPRMIGSQGTIKGPDYRFSACEGHIFNPELPQPPNTVRLYRWYDPDRYDNHTTSEASMIRWPGDRRHRDPNYSLSRLEGFIFSPEYDQPSGTVPLYRWWSPGRKDNHTTADFADLGARGEGLSPDYIRPRLMGYIYST